MHITVENRTSRAHPDFTGWSSVPGAARVVMSTLLVSPLSRDECRQRISYIRPLFDAIGPQCNAAVQCINWLTNVGDITFDHNSIDGVITATFTSQQFTLHNGYMSQTINLHNGYCFTKDFMVAMTPLCPQYFTWVLPDNLEGVQSEITLLCKLIHLNPSCYSFLKAEHQLLPELVRARCAQLL